MWFNDEEDLEDGEAVVPPSDKVKNDEDLMDPISKFMERKKRKVPTPHHLNVWFGSITCAGCSLFLRCMWSCVSQKTVWHT